MHQKTDAFEIKVSHTTITVIPRRYRVYQIRELYCSKHAKLIPFLELRIHPGVEGIEFVCLQQ